MQFPVQNATLVQYRRQLSTVACCEVGPPDVEIVIRMRIKAFHINVFKNYENANFLSGSLHTCGEKSQC